MVIFRENTEDIYAGIEFRAGSTEAKELFDFLKAKKVAKNIRFPGSCLCACAYSSPLSCIMPADQAPLASASSRSVRRARLALSRLPSNTP